MTVAACAVGSTIHESAPTTSSTGTGHAGQAVTEGGHGRNQPVRRTGFAKGWVVSQGPAPVLPLSQSIARPPLELVLRRIRGQRTECHGRLQWIGH